MKQGKNVNMYPLAYFCYDEFIIITTDNLNTDLFEWRIKPHYIVPNAKKII